MKRESYVKRLVTSYKNLSESEKKLFLKETELTTEEVSEVPEEDAQSFIGFGRSAR